MEQTLIILKPDAIEKKLIGKIISRFEEKGYSVVNIKMAKIDKKIAIEHYKHVSHLKHFNKIIDYIISGKVVILILEGYQVIKSVRNLIGQTKTVEALPGTIRGDYGNHDFKNLIHASDSKDSAKIEIDRFFSEYKI
jgi:nucleoside-diphosphate kinase